MLRCFLSRAIMAFCASIVASTTQISLHQFLTQFDWNHNNNVVQSRAGVVVLESGAGIA